MPTIKLLFAMALLISSGAVRADIQIRSENGMLSVQANNVSASVLAAELSEQLGISVVVTGDAETRVNLDIVEEPLEKALGKLSPSNMLVHNSQATEIIEIVLMMGEGTANVTTGNSEQFLPSGSPAEEIMDEQAAEQLEEAYDPQSLRDPTRAMQVRDAAEAASFDANLPAAQVPPMFADDAQGGVPADQPIDPATGLPYEQ